MESLSCQEFQSPTQANSDGLKLCIIIDSGTPIIKKVPSIYTELTLGEFKKLIPFQSDNCKFYFKSQDSEFGVVKEEVADDESYLPIYGDRIVAWIISNNTNQSTLFESETQQYKLDRDIEIPMKGRLPLSNQHRKFDHPEVAHIAVQLNLDSYNFLGLTLVGPSDENDFADKGIHVGQIAKKSVVEQDGRIEVGDRIIEINGLDLRDMKNDDAVALFRNCIERRGAINLVIQRNLMVDSGNKGRFTLPREYANVINHNTSPKVVESRFCIDDLPAPIYNQINHNIKPNIDHTQRANLPYTRSTHSLPRSITPRSLYATTNLDSIQTNIDPRFRIDSRSVYESTTPTSIRQLDVALHCGRDDIHTIYAALRNDAKSLDIKDREWLKVVVKNAFLGSTLVKWLSRNVYGFGHKREVKRFANQMLILGLIRSPITTGAFSEKCYYTLS